MDQNIPQWSKVIFQQRYKSKKSSIVPLKEEDSLSVFHSIHQSRNGSSAGNRVSFHDISKFHQIQSESSRYHATEMKSPRLLSFCIFITQTSPTSSTTRSKVQCARKRGETSDLTDSATRKSVRSSKSVKFESEKVESTAE